MASAQILNYGKALYAYSGSAWYGLNTTGNLVNATRWQKVATGGETTLSGNDDTGDTLSYTPGFEQVFLNGVLLARDLDYTATNGTTITGLTALTAGYIVEVIAYNNINVGNTYTQAQIDNKVANTFERWTKTVSASGTVISGLDDNAVTLDYTAGLEKVYVNGILLAPEEYVATSGSAVTLDEAVVTNDIIQIHTLKNFRVPNTYTIAQTDDQFLTKASASSTYLSQAAGITAATASATYAPVAAGGLVQIVPTSIAATGGSGSVSSTGLTSFTSASAISLNNCFTSNYDNYKVIINLTAASTSANLQPRFRLGGTDSSASYYNAHMYLVSGSGTGTVQQDANISSMNLGDFSSTSQTISILDIFNVFSAAVTSFNYQTAMSFSTAARSFVGAGIHNVATSYDGITIRPSTGTFTGTVQVYGYKK